MAISRRAALTAAAAGAVLAVTGDKDEPGENEQQGETCPAEAPESGETPGK